MESLRVEEELSSVKNTATACPTPVVQVLSITNHDQHLKSDRGIPEQKLPQSSTRSPKVRRESGAKNKIRADRSYIPLEDVKFIKNIFEVYDFVKSGRSAQMNVDASRLGGTKSQRRKDLLNRIESEQDEGREEQLLVKLKVQDADEIQKRRRLLLFGLVRTRPGIDSEHREDGEDECLLNVSIDDETSSDSESDSGEDGSEMAAIARRVKAQANIRALHHISENQKIVDNEIKKMDIWKMHQKLLREEAKANVVLNAMANIITPTVPLPQSVIPSSAGIPFTFFVQQIVARYFTCFFPLETEVKHFQPRSKAHIKAVKELFHVMDTNADDLVSWDEFCSHILQAGQRYLLEAELREAKIKAAAKASNSRGALAVSSRKSLEGEKVDNGEAAFLDSATPVVSLDYELVFTPEPTNSSAWQSTYPLVKYLYHNEPITRFIVSDRSRRYITGGMDGLVKLWRPDPRLLDSQNRMAVVHERNLVSMRASITDMALSPPSMGDAEVVAVAAMDGTITLLRTSSGEVVRTLLGVRSTEMSSIAVINALTSKGMDREKKEFEEDDLLSLRNRQPAVAGTVVRMPYTIPAYHDDMMEIFFGKTNRYFQGLDVVAPTYTHLKRPVAFASDVLFDFGAEKAVQEAVQNALVPIPTKKCWYATALAISCCVPVSSNAVLKNSAYLVLGYEAGAVQVYELSMNWFSVTQLSATRVEPPSARKPVHSFIVHHAKISGIMICDSLDIMVTSSDDGTLQIRSFSRLTQPMLVLGSPIPTLKLYSIVPKVPERKKSSCSSACSVQSKDSQSVSHQSYFKTEASGHTKRITCMCLNEENHLLVSGGMDHKVIFWTTRSNRMIRQVDLRNIQTATSTPTNLGSCGFPIDVSFMVRGNDPLRVVVLDNKRVIRLLNAHNGNLMGMLVDQSPTSLAMGEMLVARYEQFDDRLLLGGLCVRPWDIPRDEEYAKDYFGHKKPVIFMGIDPTLKLLVTADDESIVMWNFSILPYDLALQRRKNREQNRQQALLMARKEAEKRRALLSARKARAAALALEAAEKAAAERQRQPTKVMRKPPPRSILEMQNYDDDEEYEEEEAGVRGGSVCVSEKDMVEDEEEVQKIIALSYEDEIPVVDSVDANQFNLTYWRSVSRVVRAWKVEGGVRSVTLETTSRAGGVYVALLRERVIVQYNSFNGAILRKFIFPETACDIYSLYAGEAVLHQSENGLAPLLCGGFEENMSSGIASIFHLNHGGGDLDSDVKQQLQEEAELEGKGVKVKRQIEPGSIRSHRNIQLKNGPCTSVAIIPSLGVIVVGGRHSLSYSPIMETTTHSIPCTSLQEEPPKERQREREAAIRAARLAEGHTSERSASRNGSVGAETKRAPINLIALFPGRLVPDPTMDAKGKAQVGGTGSSFSMHDGGESVVSEAGSAKVSGVSEDDENDERREKEDKKTGVYYEDAERGLLGYIGYIVPVRDLGYVLTGSNDGIVQLWNIRSSSEVLRFRATLRVETITSLSLSCYGKRKENFDATQQSNELGFNASRSLASTSEQVRETSLKDSSYVAVGDQSGFVVLLDFNALPWEKDVPLDVIPDIETKVVVMDRWRAHRSDVRGICFVSHPEVQGESVVGRSFNGGLRRSFGANGVEKAPCFSGGVGDEGVPPCSKQTLTIVTTGEDTYTYVWAWEMGTLNCLGCFGGGIRSHVTPPLVKMPPKMLIYYELARRQYVFHRLVVGANLFHTHNIKGDVEMGIRIMEEEAARLLEADPTWQLAFWGSLGVLSEEEISHRETVWSPRAHFLSSNRTVFDQSGYQTTLQRMYERPQEELDSENPSPMLREHILKPLSSSRFHDPSTDAYAPYVFAFMRGTYSEKSVGECLFRVAKDLRPRIKKLLKKVKRHSSNLGAQFAGRRISFDRKVETPLEGDGMRASEESHFFSEEKKNSLPFQDYSQIPSRMGTPSGGIMGDMRVSGDFQLKEAKLVVSDEDNQTEQGDVLLRGTRGVAMYKLDYKDSAFLRTEHYSEVQESKAQEDASEEEIERVISQLPAILTKDCRRSALHGSCVNSLSVKRLSFSDAHAKKGAHSGLTEDLEEAALNGTPATVIMDRAYISRRREDAIREILKEEIHAEVSPIKAKAKAQEIQLAIDAGLITIENLKDFSTTNTTKVLFDKENMTVEPAVVEQTKIAQKILQTVIPASFNIKQMKEMREETDTSAKKDGEDGEEGSGVIDDDQKNSWYDDREKMRRERRMKNSFWSPARIVQTIMSWESPIPAHFRAEGQSSITSIQTNSRAAMLMQSRPISGASVSSRKAFRDFDAATRSRTPGRFHRVDQELLELPSFLLEGLGPKIPESVASTGTPASDGISHSFRDDDVVEIDLEEGAFSSRLAEAPGTLGRQVWDTALDYNEGKINLNAIVASEVRLIKSIAHQSLLERKLFVRQQQETESMEPEDEAPFSEAVPNPQKAKKPEVDEKAMSSWVDQPRPRTLRLAEVKKRMIKPPPVSTL